VEKNNIPSVSVLLPVYNAAPYLREAIDSILNQTYKDFELLAINDGSTDGSREILDEYTDPRIIIIDNPQNMGLIKTLNTGIRHARGEFLARMDADDLSKPDRFEQQINLLKKKPEIGVVGCWVQRFGVDNEVVNYPEHDDEIKASLPFFNSMVHAGAMMRKDLFERNNIEYDINYKDAEDYRLWFQFLPLTKFYSIQEILYFWRIHESQAGFTAPETSIATTKRIKKEVLNLFENNFSEEERLLWLEIATNNMSYSASTIDLIHKVLNINKKHNVFSHSILERKLRSAWKNAFLNSRKLNLRHLYLLHTKCVSKECNFTLKQIIYIYCKLIIKQ
jgi:glycosyltransferase involved in cell wall biosynthesis